MLTDYLLIVSSHEDLDVWSTIEVGIDDFKCMDMHLEFVDSSDQKHHTHATLDRENTAALAKKLKTDVAHLPDAIDEEFGNLGNSMLLPSQVEAIFQEMLEYILDHGLHYRLKRSLR